MDTVEAPDPAVDALLCAAIAERRLIAFTLDGFRRTAEPHDYGVIAGAPKLFFWQVAGGSRSGPPVGWRWGVLARMSDVQVLDGHFPGPRAAPSGRHIRWDRLIATVSPRPAERRTG